MLDRAPRKQKVRQGIAPQTEFIVLKPHRGVYPSGLSIFGGVSVRNSKTSHQDGDQLWNHSARFEKPALTSHCFEFGCSLSFPHSPQ